MTHDVMSERLKRGSSEQDVQEPDLTVGCVHQHEMHAGEDLPFS